MEANTLSPAPGHLAPGPRPPATRPFHRTGAGAPTPVRPDAGEIRYTDIATPLGPVRIAWTTRGICRVELAAAGTGGGFPDPQPGRRDDRRRPELESLFAAWFRGEPAEATLDLTGLTPFTRAVLDQVRRIPRGEVRTYGEIARALGSPGAARAVGNAVAANPVPLLIPCHRVVRSDGRLGEYSGGGPQVKARLLALEGALRHEPRREGTP